MSRCQIFRFFHGVSRLTLNGSNGMARYDNYQVKELTGDCCLAIATLRSRWQRSVSGNHQFGVGWATCRMLCDSSWIHLKHQPSLTMQSTSPDNSDNSSATGQMLSEVKRHLLCTFGYDGHVSEKNDADYLYRAAAATMRDRLSSPWLDSKTLCRDFSTKSAFSIVGVFAGTFA